MGKKLTLSFKDTKKDLELYEFISQLDDRSHDIKQILYSAFILKNMDYNSNIVISSGTRTKDTVIESKPKQESKPVKIIEKEKKIDDIIDDNQLNDAMDEFMDKADEIDLESIQMTYNDVKENKK